VPEVTLGPRCVAGRNTVSAFRNENLSRLAPVRHDGSFTVGRTVSLPADLSVALTPASRPA